MRKSEQEEGEGERKGRGDEKRKKIKGEGEQGKGARLTILLIQVNPSSTPNYEMTSDTLEQQVETEKEETQDKRSGLQSFFPQFLVTGVYIAQAGLELTMQTRMILNFILVLSEIRHRSLSLRATTTIIRADVTNCQKTSKEACWG